MAPLETGQSDPVDLVSGQQVGQQVAAQPLLGLDHRAAEEQDQSRDHGAALEGAARAEVQLDVDPADDDRPERLDPGQRRDHPDPAARVDGQDPFDEQTMLDSDSEAEKAVAER